KKVICALNIQECAVCLLLKQCLYPSIFETPQVRKPPSGANFASVPHPFVIEPPETGATQFPPQAPFNFNLLLFGEINNNLPYFIYAFDQMGKIGVGRRIKGRRGRFRLQEVRFDNRTIFSVDDGILKSPEPLPRLSLGEHESGRDKITHLTIHLQTPLRFKHRNRLSDELPFHLLVRTMLRRIDALFTIYGDGKPDLDFRGLTERAGAVKIAS
ncbi:MAG: CRISPR-associated protein Cas6, partial [Gammaproteobacteria bacterium]|nr:CRISPR-associated protein Cas6 [Gammaproteobacteria bacterium]